MWECNSKREGGGERWSVFCFWLCFGHSLWSHFLIRWVLLLEPYIVTFLIHIQNIPDLQPSILFLPSIYLLVYIQLTLILPALIVSQSFLSIQTRSLLHTTNILRIPYAFYDYWPAVTSLIRILIQPLSRDLDIHLSSRITIQDEHHLRHSIAGDTALIPTDFSLRY